MKSFVATPRPSRLAAAASRAGDVLARVGPPVGVAVVAIVALEALVRGGVVRAFLVPPPSKVLAALFEHGSLYRALGETAYGALGGFAIASLLGITLAVLFSSAKVVQRAFYPYAVFFQTVPIVAIAPMLVVWFGSDSDAVIASATIVCIFPIIASTLSGLLSTEPAQLELFRLYGAGRFDTLRKLQFPSAMPQIMTGLRVGAGLSVVGAIVGEFITTGSGLGGLMTIARRQQRVDLVFAALVLSALLGIAMFLAINLVSSRLLRHWHASERRVS